MVHLTGPPDDSRGSSDVATCKQPNRSCRAVPCDGARCRTVARAPAARPAFLRSCGFNSCNYDHTEVACVARGHHRGWFKKLGYASQNENPADRLKDESTGGRAGSSDPQGSEAEQEGTPTPSHGRQAVNSGGNNLREAATGLTVCSDRQ